MAIEETCKKGSLANKLVALLCSVTLALSMAVPNASALAAETGSDTASATAEVALAAGQEATDVAQEAPISEAVQGGEEEGEEVIAEADDATDVAAVNEAAVDEAVEAEEPTETHEEALSELIAMSGDESGEAAANDEATAPAGATAITVTADAGYTISENGTYWPNVGSTGIITIAEGVTDVTIVGNGVTWDADYNLTCTGYESLGIDATKAPGVNVTLKDIYLHSSTAPMLDIDSTDNTLTIEGIVLSDFEYEGSYTDSKANIHVGVGDELSIEGSGTLYLYKTSGGAGIGGNSGEMNGDITFDMSGKLFAKGSKQGALIGAGRGASSTTDAPGPIHFIKGEYNVVSISRGATIGGSAGSTGGSTGTTVTVEKDANININVDYSGAAVGGGGYDGGNDSSGGTLIVNGGSIRCYIDKNAANNTTGWMGKPFTEGLNDAAITAARQNAVGESVYRLVFDTSLLSTDADSFDVSVDDAEIYSGGLHKYGFYYEAIDRDISWNEIPNSTIQNWYPLQGETNLYLYVTGADHEITCNGENFDVTWNEDTESFAVAKARTVVSTWDVSKAGDNSATATLYDNGELVFSGTGAMKTYSNMYNRPYKEKLADIKKVTFEEGTNATSLKNYFRNCENLVEITSWPTGVEDMKNVCSGCTSLTTIPVLPTEAIDLDSAFKECNALVSLSKGFALPTDEDAVLDDIFTATTDEALVTYCDVEDYDALVANAKAFELDWAADWNRTLVPHDSNYDWYGDGTADSFTISTAGELQAFANIVNGTVPTALGIHQNTFEDKTVTLAGDIDLGNTAWTPVGGKAEKHDLDLKSQADLDAALETYFIVYDNTGLSYVRNSDKNSPYDSARTYYYVTGALFSGTFDGAGHTVSNVSITSQDTPYVGFFGNVNGTVENLTLSGSVNVTTSSTAVDIDFIGGITGKLSAGGTIQNCVNTMDINANAEETYNVGGIAGMVGEMGTEVSETNPMATVKNCVNEADVSGFIRVGGIAGRNAGTVTGCINKGTVLNGSKKKKGTGGIVGMNGVNNDADDAGIIEFCYNTGYINGNGGYWCGGIAGFQNAASVTRNSYNAGLLYTAASASGSKWSWVNPIVGQNEGDAHDCVWLNTDTGDNTKNYVGRDETGVGNSGGTAERVVGVDATAIKAASTVVLLDANAVATDVWFSLDTPNINNGYPALSWQLGQTERTDMSIAVVTMPEAVDIATAVADVVPTSVVLGEKELTQDFNYVIAGITDAEGNEVSAFSKAGTYTITLEGVGNYSGSVSATFEVVDFNAYKWYGDGTADNFTISTASEFEAFANIVNGNVPATLGIAQSDFAGKTVALAGDIDLTDIDWAPAGSKDAPFKGTFDGKNHAITNLAVNSDGYAGLFGQIGPEGVVKDFTVAGSVSSTSDYAGAVAGYNQGTITGVTSSATISADNAYNVGGIAGFNDGGYDDQISKDEATGGKGTIANCLVTGNVTGSTKVGGIAGENSGTVQYCAATGTVEGKNTSRKNGVGGIVGRNGNNNTAIEAGVIESCYFMGTVGTSGQKWVGGIAGLNNAKSSIKDCYMAGTLVAGDGHVNAIAGNQEGASLTSNNYALAYEANSGSSEAETGIVLSSDDLKAAAGKLGVAFFDDDATTPINNGYPVLYWQLNKELPANFTRLYGEGRYATMGAIVDEGFTQSDVAILVTGENYPDALSAAALAGAYDAPVILTTGKELSAEAKAEIERLGVKTVYVLGGRSAISSDVFEDVMGLGCSVKRIYGDSRQATSLEVYKQVIATEAAAACDTVIVASGSGFADALSISPYAYAKTTPILLTDDKGTLTEDEYAAIKANTNIKNVILVGGEGVVSAGLFEQLYSDGYKVTRLSGENRYETSAAIATWELANGLSAHVSSVATGVNFPDALAGAALTGSKDGILLLTADDATEQACGILSANKASIAQVYVYGGTGVVSDAVEQACKQAVEKN